MIAIALLAMIAAAAAQDSTSAAASTTAAAGTGSSVACDTNVFTECGTTLSKCVSDGAGTTSKLCPCYSTYISCISKSTSCPGFETVKETNVKACNALKCDSCSSASGLVASVTLVASLVASRLF